MIIDMEENSNSPVGGVQTQFAALVNAANFLIYRVDCLQNASRQSLELAQLVGLLDAMILQILASLLGLEGISSGQSGAIHFAELTSASCSSVIRRSIEQCKKQMES